MTLDIERDGAQLFPQLIDGSGLEALQRMLPQSTKPGERIYGNADLSNWLLDGPVGGIARDIAGPSCRPVRAIQFDKTPDTNWALGWHQDRTIAVGGRIELSGFDRWNSKAGVTHVEPPFSYIERMITARIHLDPVAQDNAPLMIALGSHHRGRIEETQIDQVVEHGEIFACIAEAGDGWIYRTAILHASARSTSAGSRRVLQVDYSADTLPGGLEWLGVV